MTQQGDVVSFPAETGLHSFAEEGCSGCAHRLSCQRELERGDALTESLIAGEPSDEDLLSQARAHADPGVRRELLNRLFSRCYTRIGHWCFRITGDRNSAADLAQDVLMRAYQGLDFFRGDAKFSTWLYSITRNHCFHNLRERAARFEGAIEPMVDDLPAREEFETRMEREQQVRQLRKLIQEHLDETERKVMVLHYGEEMSLEAVTRLLDLSNPSGAKAYIVRARRKLKAAVARQEKQAAALRTVLAPATPDTTVS